MRLAILVLAGLIAASCSGPATIGEAPTPPAATSPVTTGPVATSPVTTSPIGGGTAPVGITATVDTVFDGDSMRVVIDGRSDEVRLIGINATENGECYSDRARNVLFGMVGGTVTLVEDGRDQYDRILAYVYVGGTDVNEEMIRVGAALALTDDRPLFDEFAAIERTAVADRIGMWAPDACGPASTAGVTVEKVESRGDEYVRIAGGGAAADLSGWVLRDESSVHRFFFPAGLELPAGGSVTVYTGCGTDTVDSLHWCADGPVWNNAGDTALLLDANGNVAARLRYP